MMALQWKHELKVNRRLSSQYFWIGTQISRCKSLQRFDPHQKKLLSKFMHALDLIFCRWPTGLLRPRRWYCCVPTEQYSGGRKPRYLKICCTWRLLSRTASSKLELVVCVRVCVYGVWPKEGRGNK